MCVCVYACVCITERNVCVWQVQMLILNMKTHTRKQEKKKNNYFKRFSRIVLKVNVSLEYGCVVSMDLEFGTGKHSIRNDGIAFFCSALGLPMWSAVVFLFTTQQNMKIIIYILNSSIIHRAPRYSFCFSFSTVRLRNKCS